MASKVSDSNQCFQHLSPLILEECSLFHGASFRRFPFHKGRGSQEICRAEPASMGQGFQTGVNLDRNHQLCCSFLQEAVRVRLLKIAERRRDHSRVEAVRSKREGEQQYDRVVVTVLGQYLQSNSRSTANATLDAVAQKIGLAVAMPIHQNYNSICSPLAGVRLCGPLCEA